MMVAIDAGHGYVKAISSRGERRIFPALIHPAPTGVDFRHVWSGPDDAD